MAEAIDLTGQVALVAGGTRGATRAIAVELGRAGATGGLIIELTDAKRGDPYRNSLYYDLAKEQVARLAYAIAADLQPYGVAAVALAPGYLRSEEILDRFGVTEHNWRDAVAADPHFAHHQIQSIVHS